MTRFAELGRFRRSSWIGSLLATSALFGAMHAYQGLSGIIATGLTGLVFGGVYLTTGRNLWACIVRPRNPGYDRVCDDVFARISGSLA
jgi:hypothetical protein